MVKYLMGFVALILIGGGVVLFGQKQSVLGAAPGDKPWIEVLVSKVSATSTAGVAFVLQTGDEVEAGYTIATDGTGVALVHFPDGSFAKLDPQSSMTIQQAAYDPKSGKTNVRILLSIGGLWSKVLDLVGTESSWQVETSNAVATVRGTAFGTIAKKGRTTIVGIEHTVSVQLKTSDSAQPLETETSVSEDTEVTVDDSRLPAIAAGKEKLVTTPLSRTVTESAEFQSFSERATTFDTERDELRARAADELEFRKEFRTERVKEFTEEILRVRKERRDTSALEVESRVQSVETNDREDTETKTEKPRSVNTIERTSTSVEKTERAAAPARAVEETRSVNTNQRTNTPVEQTERTSAPTATVEKATDSSSTPKPVSLIVSADRDLTKGVTENETVAFHATLLFSDNTKRDVTTSVAWNVISRIGTFSSAGVFRAELTADAAEQGRIPGAVYATYTNADGTELNAGSDLFSVQALIPAILETGG